ncbi:hypothetical protein K470DRAFT_265619 [Piedraia hortae CBS 480.64]|uniref:Uncharacterized protein n=1 Tax=Piedraia hortae CBS 480.64 TaxID=1314780 RepID=A0A6A7BUX2_9PEZI|nr:hypothetical protein K470DRAFT_265619 [Piedraia hortae CBS 480.64]
MHNQGKGSPMFTSLRHHLHLCIIHSLLALTSVQVRDMTIPKACSSPELQYGSTMCQLMGEIRNDLIRTLDIYDEAVKQERLETNWRKMISRWRRHIEALVYLPDTDPGLTFEKVADKVYSMLKYSRYNAFGIMEDYPVTMELTHDLLKSWRSEIGALDKEGDAHQEATNPPKREENVIHDETPQTI